MFSPITGTQMIHPAAPVHWRTLGSGHRSCGASTHDLSRSVAPVRICRQKVEPVPISFLRTQLKCCPRLSCMTSTLESSNVGRFHAPHGCRDKPPLPRQPTLADFALPSPARMPTDIADICGAWVLIIVWLSGNSQEPKTGGRIPRDPAVSPPCPSKGNITGT